MSDKTRRPSPVKKVTAKTATAKKVTEDKKTPAKKSVVNKTNSPQTAPNGSTTNPKLLSGGNPQITKGDGDAPVQAYIAAMPDWKRDVGRRLDALIERTVPDIQKAVRWNSPFYGIEGQGWIVSYHCFNKYVKVTFFRGSELKPEPPVGSKDPYARYHHVHEDGDIDEEQFISWVKQASELPGWIP